MTRRLTEKKRKAFIQLTSTTDSWSTTFGSSKGIWTNSFSVILTADNPLASTTTFHLFCLNKGSISSQNCSASCCWPLCHDSPVRSAVLLCFSKHSAVKYKSQPNINQISCPEKCFLLSFSADGVDRLKPVFLSLTLYISLQLSCGDEWPWMSCSRTFAPNAQHTSLRPRNYGPGVWHVLWAAADRCPHGNTNNNFTEPSSENENILKLGRNGWGQSAENSAFEEYKYECKRFLFDLKYASKCVLANLLKGGVKCAVFPPAFSSAFSKLHDKTSFQNQRWKTGLNSK